MRLILSVCLFMAFTSCRSDADKILLRLKYTKGDVYTIRFQRYSTLSESKKVLSNEVITMRYRVNAVTNDTIALICKIDGMKYRTASEHVIIDEDYYSSDEDEADMTLKQKKVHDLFKDIKNLEFSLKINNRGEVVQPYTLPNKTIIAQPFSPIDYKICQIVFPEKPVLIGQTWENIDSVGYIDGKKTTYLEIESLDNSVIKIGVKGSIEIAKRKHMNFTGSYTIDKKSKKLIAAKLFFDTRFFMRDGIISIDIKAADLVSFPVG